MRVLITGAAGFAGSHLAEHCLAEGDEVWGTCFQKGTAANLVGLLDRMTLRIGDVTNSSFLPKLLSEVAFDVVYNLAGISFVPFSEHNPRRVFDVNLAGGLNLLEAVRAHSPRTRVVLISSAEVYGSVGPEDLPVKESQLFAPANILGSSKAALEMAARPYLSTYGLEVVIVRPFNHTGPRQVAEFVCSSFARQIAEVEAGAEPVIKVGNLTPRRDFTDVRDIVRGYRCLAICGERGEAYNLASGRSIAVAEILDLLVRMARVRVEVREDPARVRNVQVMDVRGDASKLRGCCGWEPRIPLEKTLRDLLNGHRDTLRGTRPAAAYRESVS